MNKTIFQKIIDREIPANILYEDNILYGDSYGYKDSKKLKVDKIPLIIHVIFDRQ